MYTSTDTYITKKKSKFYFRKEEALKKFGYLLIRVCYFSIWFLQKNNILEDIRILSDI